MNEISEEKAVKEANSELGLQTSIGADAKAEAVVGNNSETLVRRGKISEQQRRELDLKISRLRNVLISTVYANGAGQALAWLESQATEEASLLQVRLAIKLGLDSPEQSLVSEYSKYPSIEAIAFRKRLLELLITDSLSSNSDSSN